MPFMSEYRRELGFREMTPARENQLTLSSFLIHQVTSEVTDDVVKLALVTMSDAITCHTYSK